MQDSAHRPFPVFLHKPLRGQNRRVLVVISASVVFFPKKIKGIRIVLKLDSLFLHVNAVHV